MSFHVPMNPSMQKRTNNAGRLCSRTWRFCSKCLCDENKHGKSVPVFRHRGTFRGPTCTGQNYSSCRDFLTKRTSPHIYSRGVQVSASFHGARSSSTRLMIRRRHPKNELNIGVWSRLRLGPVPRSGGPVVQSDRPCPAVLWCGLGAMVRRSSGPVVRSRGLGWCSGRALWRSRRVLCFIVCFV